MLKQQNVSPDHPDCLRWNKKYRDRSQIQFKIHPLITDLIATGLLSSLPSGPVLEIAAGLSGAALALAERGSDLWGVDVSDLALNLLDQEAARQNLNLTLIHADLEHWIPAEAEFALVYATRYWHREVFINSCRAVRPGGILAWEAFTEQERLVRPTFSLQWCLSKDEPDQLLPEDFEIIEVGERESGRTRRIVARRNY